jgi:hypothetical protein
MRQLDAAEQANRAALAEIQAILARYDAKDLLP